MGELAFTDEMNGLLQTDNWDIYRTNDGGVTWSDMTLLYTGLSRNVDIAAVQGMPNAYVALGEDFEVTMRSSSYTVDGGLTWVDISDNPD